MPTFSFLKAPEYLTIRLLRRQNAPLPLALKQSYSFGTILDARLFSAPGHSTSELLRTL
jgi:hypothetical protein